MPSFFLKGKGKAKEKNKGPKIGVKRKAKKAETDEEIGSDSDILSDKEEDGKGHESDSSLEETAQEKRLRLAKEYISKLEQEERLKVLEEQVDRDAVAHRLQEDVLSEKGILQRQVADEFSGYDEDNIKTLRGHQLSVTCLVVSNDDSYIYSGSKDGTIIKWSTKSGVKEYKINEMQNSDKNGKKDSKHGKSQNGHILCLALSTDGKFLASGGKETGVKIWNGLDLTFIRIFNGHKKAITGLVFRKGTHQLFSASMDRSIKVWNLDEMTYVETLFGHEDAITAIDSLAKDRAVTSGGRDRTIRLWKIPEESQLVFRARNTPSIDCVAMINEEYYVSGADDGSISLWNMHKKKPLVTVRNAHHIDKKKVAEASECGESWITSVAALRNSDLIASAGSCDQCIRVWKCEKGFSSLQQLFSVHVFGFINGLQFAPSGDFIVAGVGQEHRLGRWWRLKSAKNSVLYIPLNKT